METKTTVKKVSSNKKAKTPNINLNKTVKAKAPRSANVGTTVIPVAHVPEVRRSRGRPTGSCSYIVVSLASLNKILNPDSQVLIDRTYGKLLKINNLAELPAVSSAVATNGCNGAAEPTLTPSVTTFEEDSASPRNGVVSITEEKN